MFTVSYKPAVSDEIVCKKRIQMILRDLISVSGYVIVNAVKTLHAFCQRAEVVILPVSLYQRSKVRNLVIGYENITYKVLMREQIFSVLRSRPDSFAYYGMDDLIVIRNMVKHLRYRLFFKHVIGVEVLFYYRSE